MEWNFSKVSMLHALIDRCNVQNEHFMEAINTTRKEGPYHISSLTYAIDQNNMLIALCEEKITELMKR